MRDATDGTEDAGSPGAAAVRLPVRPPFDRAALLDFLRNRAVAGVEACDGTTYRRALRLPGGPVTLALTPSDDHVACTVRGARPPDGQAAEQAAERAATVARRMLDLDADAPAIVADLGRDPLLGPLVRARPGLRVPGHPDPFEVLVRAIVGQQVSVAGARTVLGRIVAALGEPLAAPDGPVTTCFPTPEEVAAAPPAVFPMPRARAETLRRVAAAVAAGELDLAGDARDLERRLLAVPGIGPWTVAYVALRALGDRDVFLPTDLGVRRALERLGLPGDPRSAAARAEAWRPWRSYALLYLWTAA
ncbi:MAG TPA: AlkA N-terminal domain-containing protein [Acidimicrobiales bacterium]